MEGVQGDSDAMLERIALVEDMRAEWEQTEVLRSLLSQAPSLSLTEMDEVIRVCVCVCVCARVRMVCVCVCVCVC